MAWAGGYLRRPTSLRLTQLGQATSDVSFAKFENTDDSHSSLGQLCILVLLAVSDVLCITLAGYVVARLGLFNADKRKFLSNLNVTLFTPCLIFSMLASQLSTDKLSDLSIIPVIFIVQLVVSWLAAVSVSRALHFGRRASNFITAMSVFANSNSLPPPLVLSLARTLKGLYWDRIPGDNDGEVAARGILYIVIFQQLSNLLRWSWGYHVLLPPKHKYLEYQEQNAEQGRNYRDEEEHDQCEAEALIGVDDSETAYDDSHSSESRHHESTGRTPVGGHSQLTLPDLAEGEPGNNKSVTHRPENHVVINGHNDDSLFLLPRIHSSDDLAAASEDGIRGMLARVKHSIKRKLGATKTLVADGFIRLYQALPAPIQAALRFFKLCWNKTSNFLSEFMNPPLWAMLIAVVVASVPVLQKTLFEDEYIKNSITSAIESCGNVAVPLMLVVLGANLARDASAEEDDEFDPEEEKIGTKLLVASLVSRMLIPTVVLTPILIVTVKYVNVAILEDPIFVIVCFLISGAPTALQLAQICQINNVFEKTMDRILFHSYAIWLLPSTLVLVMLALQAVQ
ncbi:auxin efflux carrier superfamily protein [Xylaria digitata]|nr:auxin efflux carrier superfamily protein [Xylaria digitata]